MQVCIRKTHKDICQAAAQEIAELVKRKPNAVLGLATGSTPIPLYDELVKMENAGEIDLSKVTTFNLDEYEGLAEDHPESYHYYMDQNFFSRLNNPPKNINIPKANLAGEKLEKHCQKYDKKIQKLGGIDIQILGIGGEGHIGFNEAGSSATSLTRRIALAERTIDDAHEADNGFKTKEEVPTHAVTMGIWPIRNAKKCIVLANGEGKSEISQRVIQGSPSTEVPASLLKYPLRSGHEVTFYLDEAASSKLEDRQKYIDAEKPELRGNYPTQHGYNPELTLAR